MAKVIITGTPEENKKTLAALKEQFYTVEKKADVFSRGEQTTVAEIYLNDYSGDGFSCEEVLKALECHAKREKDCANCVYKKMPNCHEKMLMDAAIVVSKMHRDASRRGEKNDDK